MLRLRKGYPLIKLNYLKESQAFLIKNIVSYQCPLFYFIKYLIYNQITTNRVLEGGTLNSKTATF